jgi:hypothetical protein
MVPDSVTRVRPNPGSSTGIAAQHVPGQGVHQRPD